MTEPNSPKSLFQMASERITTCFEEAEKYEKKNDPNTCFSLLEAARSICQSTMLDNNLSHDETEQLKLIAKQIDARIQKFYQDYPDLRSKPQA